jgi:predicted kinase
MPTVHLICGMPGTGKSTLAAKIEREHRALRLTPDDWMAQLFGGDGRDADMRAKIEAAQFTIALRALELGLDVVLDNGFWHRWERDACRAGAASVGAETRLYYLDIPKEEAKRRLALRNQNLPPNTFKVTAEDLDEWWDYLEKPTEDEPGLFRMT